MDLKYLYYWSLASVLIINTSYFTLNMGATYTGWFSNFNYALGVIFFLPLVFKQGRKGEILYVLIMLLGFVFHSMLPSVNQPFYDSMKWVLLICLLICGRIYRLPRFSFHILVAFFLIHCGLAMIEYYNQRHIIDYRFVEDFDNYFNNSSVFRAFGLMAHPLFAANIVLILMSFLLISNDLNIYLKIFLISFGTISLVCFNSRAAMIIWGCILLYRLFLYNRNPFVIIIFGIAVYSIFLSDISIFIQQNSNIFGRLSEKGSLSDDSSMTRIVSYALFINQRWDIQDIMSGGRMICMPGSDLWIENGVLLTISWWGWIIGSLKIVLEMIISFQCLSGINIKDKVIVMIACWLTAFANNNSMFTFVFAFFIISYLVLNSIKSDRRVLFSVGRE